MPACEDVRRPTNAALFVLEVTANCEPTEPFAGNDIAIDSYVMWCISGGPTRRWKDIVKLLPFPHIESVATKRLWKEGFLARDESLPPHIDDNTQLLDHVAGSHDAEARADKAYV